MLAPGLLTTIQEPRGRPGYERYGVAAGGALDAVAAEAANRLVGNPRLAPLLEITLLGPSLRFNAAASAIGLAGADLGARLDGQPLPPGWSWLARPGTTLTFAETPPTRGARAYLAAAGGLRVPYVLGSPSTDLGAGFGGLEGRPLRAGDRLDADSPPDVVTHCGQHLPAAASLPDPTAPVRILPGPHLRRFAADALDCLCATEWRIASHSDRMGYRLSGPPLRHRHGADTPSLGLPVGAIQVPGDGQPIVLLADHQPTGGYTVLACVIRADLPVLAQRRPGDAVRFALTSPAAARAALQAQRSWLAAAGSRDDARVWDDAGVWEGLRRAESLGVQLAVPRTSA